MKLYRRANHNEVTRRTVCISCDLIRSFKMVLFGRKEKVEDRRLLDSIDAMNGTKLYQMENAAFMHVRDNLEELGKVAEDTDLLFLKGLLDSPVVTSLVKLIGNTIHGHIVPGTSG
ncbi:uncharacterized protein LOC143185091 [Calliopsis andreniformis]|uniref:uncharacterized protein LOC143185091 n=1 Tax=Calliopsis andreniformis TaxID=337506 RepID=UPI003FCD6854